MRKKILAIAVVRLLSVIICTPAILLVSPKILPPAWKTPGIFSR